MRVLVTGGAGFIGSNLVRWLLREEPRIQVTNLDALTYAGNLASLADVDGDERYAFVHGDITDRGLLEEVLPGHDLVINVAAESHNSYAVKQPGHFFRTNVLGTQTLLEAARHAGVGRVHHISTCEVYGDLPLDADAAFTEASPYRPATPYSASKAAADHAARAYHNTFGLDVTITNCANTYGPYQFPEKVIPLFSTYALEDRPLPLYASTEHRREWIHVLDHCRAIWLVAREGEPGQTYHVGTGVERSIADLAGTVLRALDKPDDMVEIVPDRPGHDRRYLLDSTRIHETFGWRPEVDFDHGLEQTIAWYSDNRDWWEPLRDRAPVVEERAWSPSG